LRKGNSFRNKKNRGGKVRKEDEANQKERHTPQWLSHKGNEGGSHAMNFLVNLQKKGIDEQGGECCSHEVFHGGNLIANEDDTTIGFKSLWGS